MSAKEVNENVFPLPTYSTVAFPKVAPTVYAEADTGSALGAVDPVDFKTM